MRYAVSNDNVFKLIQPGAFDDQLTEILRQGARTLLAQAVEAEVADFLAEHGGLRTEDGRQRLVRHGHLPEREVMTGIGAVAVRQPRVRDRGVGAGDAERIRFTPAILPPYMRRSKSIETLLPILYLKGISSPRHSRYCSARTHRGFRQPPSSVQGWVDRRASGLAETRSIGETLRLHLGRWHLFASPT
jgi:hypothetical protein